MQLALEEIIKAIEQTQNRYKTPKQTMEYLNISRTTLWKWVNEDGLPQITKGGITLYDRKDIDEFLEKYKV